VLWRIVFLTHKQPTNPVKVLNTFDQPFIALQGEEAILTPTCNNTPTAYKKELIKYSFRNTILQSTTAKN
jgi:hypothetical protein